MNNLLATPKHSDLVYDVGLHRGEDTVFYLRKGFRVVAFEANSELVKICRERFAEFIRRGQLKIIEGAIVDQSTLGANCQKVRFYKNESGSWWGTTCHEWAERNQILGTSVSVTEVAAVDFERVLEAEGIPHYMKIDIEGCDTVCLKALKRFKERPNYVSFESDKTRFTKIVEEITLLEELGYDRFQAIEQMAIPQSQRPPMPATEGRYATHSFERGSSGLFGSELFPKWRTRREILRLYRFIHIGYRLLGDDGIMYRWRFPGASRLRRLVKHVLERVTRANVPGWFDTHARQSGVSVQNGSVRHRQ